MDEIKLQIKGKEQDTYAIHYSCSGFYNGGAVAPTICAIALVNYATKELHSFALHNYIVQGKSLMESEQQLLRDFVEFFKSLNKSFLVHWNMEGLSFGFIPIKARAENFGFYNLDLSKAKGYNLSNIFHSNLMASLEQNSCLPLCALYGKEEAECLNKRAFDMVKMSTEGKAQGLSELLTKYLSNSLAEDDDAYILY